jgi:parallel beta-helix repeat protein
MKLSSHFAAKKFSFMTKSIAPALLTGRAFLCAGLVIGGLFCAAPDARALDGDDHNATPVTACGTVISQSGRYFLANDLKQCPGFGISIAVSDVEVELRGHTIQATFGDSAVVANGGTTGLSNLEIEGPGTITGGLAGISFGNVHHSRVHNLVLVRNNFGMGVNSGDFTSDATVQATASTENEFRDNVVTNNVFTGISVNGGNQNRFIRNNLSGNGFQIGHGLDLFNAKNNVVRHNTADANSSSGISTGPFSAGNLIDDNTALGNGGPDLNDGNGDCAHNTWTGNSFNSNSPACIQ